VALLEGGTGSGAFTATHQDKQKPISLRKPGLLYMQQEDDEHETLQLNASTSKFLNLQGSSLISREYELP
jgi:hypothetical protein